MFSRLYRVTKQVSQFCFNHITTAQWRWIISNENSRSDPSRAVYYTQLFAIIPTCLPFKFPWRKVEKNVLSIRGSMASVMCDPSRKLHGVQLFPLNTKDSGITSRLRHTSSWRKQPELSATSLTPCSHPPKPATAYPNYPTGIENSTRPMSFGKAGCEISHTKFGGTEGCWHRTAVSSSCVKSRSHRLPFICKVSCVKDSFTFGCTDRLKLRRHFWVCVFSVRNRNTSVCVWVHACGIRSSCKQHYLIKKGSTPKRHYHLQKTLGERLSQGTAETWLGPIVLAQRMRKQHPFLP